MLTINKIFPQEKIPEKTESFLFFDIETTGLSADISAITVIGCCDMDGNVTQWFNEDGLSQKQILTDFLAFIQPLSLIHI